jgi:predicted XRE-type DNA-binding protein
MNHIGSGVSETLAAIMFGLQRAANKRISYASMASELGVSQRAFSEWMRGAREPAAMDALLRMLSMLPDEEVSRVLAVWRGMNQPAKKPNVRVPQSGKVIASKPVQKAVSTGAVQKTSNSTSVKKPAQKKPVRRRTENG